MEWVIVGRFEANVRGRQILNATEREVNDIVSQYEGVSIKSSPYVGAFELESDGRFPDDLLRQLSRSLIFQASAIYPEGRI